MPQRRFRQAIGAEYVLAAIAIAAALPLAYAAHRPAWPAWLALTAVCLGTGIWVGFFLRRRALQRLDGLVDSQRDESLRFHTAINNMAQGLCFFNGERRLIVCNRRYAEMYGLTMEQVKPGTALEEIVDHRFNAGAFPTMSRDEYLKWRNSIAVSNQRSETVTELSDGRVFAIHHQPMPDGGWVATHEDITQERRALARIEHLARSDALTDLPNRMQFRHRLVELLRPGATSEEVAVLFVDLDHFKAVNDTLGHAAGDELLRAAAKRLCRCVRQMDLVARLGGDEFAIIQSGAAQPPAAQALADRLVREFAEPFDIGGHPVRVGASVGVALSPADGTDPDDLLKNADLALYEAKAGGRGGHCFFRPQLVEQALGRRTLPSEPAA